MAAFSYPFTPGDGITRPSILGCSPAQIKTAIEIIVSMLEGGYNLNDPNTVLSTYGWASLSAELVAAICKGIARTEHLTLDDSALLCIRKDCKDPFPPSSNPNFSLFDHIALLSKHLTLSVDSFEDLHSTMVETRQKLEQLKLREARRSAEVTALALRDAEIDRLTKEAKNDIKVSVQACSREGLTAAAQKLGFHIAVDPDWSAPLSPSQVPSLGK
jgi:hypothetical protein